MEDIKYGEVKYLIEYTPNNPERKNEKPCLCIYSYNELLDRLNHLQHGAPNNTYNSKIDKVIMRTEVDVTDLLQKEIHN